VKNTHKIRDLEQIRLLSDPLKLRLLQAFAESARTTKAAAVELGESVTKLYRHVDALHDAGLIEVVEENQKRGTIERTFRAVAQRFEADHSLFTDAPWDEGTIAARDMLRVTEAEILNMLANTHDDTDERAIIMRVRGKASPEKVAELRGALNAWLESLPDHDDTQGEATQEFGGLIAFYEID
jgi:predicted ArsR family transcriptional regulator